MMFAAILGEPISAVRASAQNAERERAVNLLFAPYDLPSAPGCAVGISERGKLVFARGYGQADLTWSRPIAADTIFDVASDAKQFTAFAIALLASRGKLSLADDVRKHVPELRDFGQRLTLRHMLEHTSGLPDHPSLAAITGRGGGSLLTPDVALRLLRDVRELDFQPGTDWAYSNSNFLLLGLVAERVSGKPLGDFLKEEVFTPLGMSRTSYEPDPRPIVAGRASPYAAVGDRFISAPYPASDGGGKGIQTTVGDMLKWAYALDTGRIGGEDVARQMRTPRRLMTGELLTYGMGLDAWNYRGQPIVLHGGNGTGHRSQAMRFPTLGLGIAVICNRTDAKQDALVRAVADAWLGDRLAPVAAPEPVSAGHRAAAGEYISDRGQVLQLLVEGDTARAEGLTGELLRANGGNAFVFETGGRPGRLKLRGGGLLTIIPAQGRAVTYRKLEAVTLSPDRTAQYVGRYLSPDYGGVLSFSADGNQLRLLTATGEERAVRPTTADRFVLGRTTSFHFERAANGEVQRLIVSHPRARRVSFERVR
jgi:CubicO group peptidase (beta-lactamase class C family)